MSMSSLAPSQADAAMGRKSRLPAKRFSMIAQMARAFWRRPGSYFAMLGGVCLSGAIFVNALLLQPERHPAPMFASSTPMRKASPVPLPPARAQETAEPVKKVDLSAEIQAELTRRGFFVGATGVSAGTSLENAIRDFQDAAGLKVDGQVSDAVLAQLKASKLTLKDQIQQLLKPGQAPAEQQKTLISVQRALNKLGYGPLREDGVFGAGSKAALERFEKDRKLQVKGDPQGRVLRELASASGMAVE